MMPMPVKHDENERGAVLLTTLLLLAVIAAITVAIVDDIRFSIRRTASVQSAEQLSWYQRGAESFGSAWLESQITDTQTELSQFINAGEPVIFPIDQGMLAFELQDGGNCYNVNVLAVTKNKNIALKKFASFLNLLEIDSLDAHSIGASIQDWVDADGIPTSGGAEGMSYANLKPAYHAANTLMVDISELREVQGIDEITYQNLLPFVCARPTLKQSRVNLNTLTLEQAPLLAITLGGRDGVLAAQTIIEQRPLEGYASVNVVWKMDVIQDLDLKGEGKEMLRTTTDLVKLIIRTQLDTQTRTRLVFYKLSDSTGVKLVSRRPI
ncbi:MAG: hypothetical protein COA43_03065 [Robiginitomaculum sp.]|nr:MAG: hypothetical protein COA43_03065 [Robiginitomaculum sp.]